MPSACAQARILAIGLIACRHNVACVSMLPLSSPETYAKSICYHRCAYAPQTQVRQEDRIEICLYQLFDNHLCDSIADSGHTQDPFAAPTLFRNRDCAHRRWKVAARTHPIPDLVEVTPQIFVELLERLPIHAGCAAIGPDRFIRFVHTLLIDMKRLVCRDRRRHPVSSCSVNPTHLIRPLCSGPITGPSALIQVGPSQTLASVLWPRGFGRFSVSLGIQGLVPAVPRENLHPL